MHNHQVKHLNLSAYLCLTAAAAVAPWLFTPAQAEVLANNTATIPVDPATLRPDPNKQTVLPPLNFEQSYDSGKISIRPEYSEQSGFVLNSTLAKKFTGQTAGALLLTGGEKRQEIIGNLGVELADKHRILTSLGIMRQKLDFGFVSGASQEYVNQYSGVVGYQYRISDGLLNAVEFNGYGSRSPSRDLDDKEYAVDTASLYELWRDSRRIAGSRIMGYQAQLVLAPYTGATFKLGAGAEQLRYDLQSGEDKTTRATGHAEWHQAFSSGFNFKLTANTATAQNLYGLNLGQNLRDDQRLSLGYTLVQERNGSRLDRRINVAYSWLFGSQQHTPAPTAPTVKQPERQAAAVKSGGGQGSLLNMVAARPSVMPAQVVAKLDGTATPTRLVAVAKSGLPGGSSVNTTTSQITVPLGTTVTSIASITRNSAAFSNAGQFSLSSNNLIIDPKNLQQPAAGVTDTYVVTLNNSGGGTTLATVVVTHGSVKIDSITLSAGDTTAPVASADSASTAFNTAKTGIDVLANDSDNSGIAPTLTGVLTNPAGGTFTINDGKIDFTPTSGFSGNASVTYEIKDAANNKATGVLTVVVAADPAPPTATTVTGVTTGSTYTASVTPDWAVASGTTVTATLDGAAYTKGTAISADGAHTLVLTTTKTSNGKTATTTVNFTLDVNAPTATVVTGITTGSTYTASVTPDWTVATGTTVTATLDGVAYTKGTAISTDGAHTLILITTKTSNGKTTTTTINFTTAIAPVANADSTSTAYNTAKTGIDVLANDSDNSGIAPTLTGVLTSQVGGVFTVNAGKIDFTPTSGFSGNASVTYEIQDAAGNKSTGTLTVTVAAAAGDTTPDAFTFVDQTGVALSTLTESAAITVAGINTASPISVSGGEYQINGGAWTSTTGTVSNGQTVKVRHTSSASNSATTNTVLTIGGVADTFTSTTLALAVPSAPTSFSLVADTGVSGSDAITSNGNFSWASVSGAASYEVSTDGTTWTDIGNVTSYNFASGLVQGSNTVSVRAKNAAGVSTAASKTITFDTVNPPSPASLVLAGTSGEMAGYTRTTAIAVTFPTVTDNATAVNYLLTASATTPLSSDGGWSTTPPTSYTLPTGNAVTTTLYAWAMDAAGNIQPVARTQSIKLDARTPAAISDTLPTLAYGAATGTTTVTFNKEVNCATLSGTWTNYAGGADLGGSFSCTGVSGDLKTATFSYTLPSVAVGTQLKMSFSGSAYDAYATSLSGKKSVSYLTIQAAPDTTPDAFSFTDQSNVALSTLTESAAITVAGINTASPISVTGGEYQIDGGVWTSTAGTVGNGQTVKVRHTSSASNNTATHTVLTIGGVADTFTTTTQADALAPSAPSVTGVSENGLYSAPVAATWSDAAGTTSSATLDGAAYSKGNAISSNGSHTLVVTTTKTANGLTATTTIHFDYNSSAQTITSVSGMAPAVFGGDVANIDFGLGVKLASTSGLTVELVDAWDGTTVYSTVNSSKLSLSGDGKTLSITGFQYPNFMGFDVSFRIRGSTAYGKSFDLVTTQVTTIQ